MLCLGFELANLEFTVPPCSVWGLNSQTLSLQSNTVINVSIMFGLVISTAIMLRKTSQAVKKRRGKILEGDDLMEGSTM